MYMKFVLIIVLFFLNAALYGQDSTNNSPVKVSNTPPSTEVANKPPMDVDVGAPSTISVMTTNELWLSFGVLIFGFLVMLVELYLMRVSQFDQGQALKFILVTLVITSALFLIAAGFSNNQIASAMGLLGTIAGYLLGRSQSDDVSTSKNAKN